MAPRTAEAEPVVVLIKTGLFGDVAKGAVAIVAHHEIRRTVLSIVVRHRVAILVGALVKRVETKINIQPAVAVIIGNSRSRECSSRWIFKVKRVRLGAKFSSAKIAE